MDGLGIMLSEISQTEKDTQSLLNVDSKKNPKPKTKTYRIDRELIGDC